MLAPARTNPNLNSLLAQLFGLLPGVSAILLLAVGAYELAGGADEHTVYCLLVSTVVLSVLGWVPWIGYGIAYNTWRPMLPLSFLCILIPAAIHLAFNKQGRVDAFFAMDIVDIILGALCILQIGILTVPAMVL